METTTVNGLKYKSEDLVMENQHREMLEAFTQTLLDFTQPRTVLSVGLPNISSSADQRIHPEPQDIFPTIPIGIKKPFTELTFDEGEFDLILGSIPLGLQGKNIGLHTFETNNLNWELILRLSKNLTKEGVGIFVIEPLGFHGVKGEKFINRMNKEGVFIKGYINLPEKIFNTWTSLRPILVITSRYQTKQRVGEIVIDSDVRQLCLEIFDSGINYSVTKAIPDGAFKGFYSLEVEKQISQLETRYKDFKAKKLEELVESFVSGKSDDDFEELNNCLYFKKSGNNSFIHMSKYDLTGRIDNYFQVQFKPAVLNLYLQTFFRSDLGELVLKSITQYISIPRLSKELLLSAEIPIPELSTQNQIIEVIKRLDMLERDVEQLKKQASLNPINVSTLSKVDSMLEISKSLTDGDKLKSLVAHGESQTLEFKQTFQYCIRNLKKEDKVEVSCLKTIVAFLNSNGGILLVGVEDSGLIPGIDFERSKFHRDSNDKFLLHLKDKIKSRLGSTSLSFIDTKIVEVDNVTVLEIICKPSDQEVFLDKKDFYIRSSPSTEKLEGTDLASYLRSRFS